MNIIDIYNKYHIPENLQMHMLRVAGCSNLIIDNWKGQELDKQAIIRVCLLHDMGNMVKIPEDFSNDEEFIKISRTYFEKYRTNDHEINLEIGKIEGLSEKEMVILDGKRSRKNEETLKSNSYEIKICAYCDQRVAPDGVVNLKERLEKQGILIDIDDSIKKYVIKNGTEKNYGARPLRRAIQTIIEDNITDNILDGKIIINVRKTMFENEGKITFK